jgi:ATP-binding cassette subfamily B protein
MDLGLAWVLAFIIDKKIPIKGFFNLWWCVVMVALSVGARSINIIVTRMAAWVARNTTRTLRHDLFEKIMNQSGAQLDTSHTFS